MNDRSEARQTSHKGTRREESRTATRLARRWPTAAALGRRIALAWLPMEAAVIAISLLLLALSGPWLPELKALDADLATSVYALGAPALTTLFLALTFIGSGWLMTVLALLVGWWMASRRAAIRGTVFVFAMIGGTAISEFTKLVFQRARPDDLRLATATGYSFPSGHSLAAACFFGGLLLLLWHRQRGPLSRALAASLAVLLIAGIGFSRVYLGVHYPSDVVAGWLTGVAWLAVVAWTIRAWMRARYPWASRRVRRGARPRSASGTRGPASASTA